EAIDNLSDLPTSPATKNELEKLIKQAEKIDLTKYTKKTVSELEAMLKRAQNVYEDNKAEQKEVDQAVDELTEAIDNLSDLPASPATKNELEKLIKQAEEIDLTIYTQETVSELEAALKQAQNVYENNKAGQKEIDQAVLSLEKAISQLEEGKKEEEEYIEEDFKELAAQKNPVENDNSKDDKQEAESANDKLDQDKELPSTATNIFNLFALSLVMIILGLLLFRKRKIN